VESAKRTDPAGDFVVVYNQNLLAYRHTVLLNHHNLEHSGSRCCAPSPTTPWPGSSSRPGVVPPVRRTVQQMVRR